MDRYLRESLLQGLDQIGQTLTHEADISLFEQRRTARRMQLEA
jgi:3-isopropylmalate dehydratase small subunit